MESRTENNILIAQFMGYRLASCNNGKAWEMSFSKYSKDDKYDLHGRLFRNNDSHYKWESSWDWLMPVLEKIQSYGASALIGRFFCEIKYGDPIDPKTSFDVRMASGININATYEAVVQFIKWYNENK